MSLCFVALVSTTTTTTAAAAAVVAAAAAAAVSLCFVLLFRCVLSHW